MIRYFWSFRMGQIPLKQIRPSSFVCVHRSKLSREEQAAFSLTELFPREHFYRDGRPVLLGGS